MATHSSVLAWRISWTEEPGRPQSMASIRVRHDLVTKPNQTEKRYVSFAQYVLSIGSVLPGNEGRMGEQNDAIDLVCIFP